MVSSAGRLLPATPLAILVSDQTPRRPDMNSLPSEIAQFILHFAGLFRTEVFDSFIYLFLGLLMGEAKSGTVRASVFAPADYQPQRLSDLFARHKLSHQAFMAKLVAVVLGYLYPSGLPKRLFWIADSTQTEKPYAERVASLGWFHRTKRVAGRSKKLKGHCYVYAAHLYQHTTGKLWRWVSLLVGALLYVKGQSIPQLVGELAKHLRLPPGVRHCWVVDRGIVCRHLCRALDELQQGLLGRLRCNQVVYFLPPPSPTGGRPRLFGDKCRVDQLRERYPGRLRRQEMKLRVGGQRHT